jgi:nitrite reductase/ring-hydroxylating ferredoxin subunit
MGAIPLAAVPEAGSAIVEVDGCRVLVCRHANEIRAIKDLCPHQTLSLEGARIRRGSLFCPHHGARFSLDDGSSMSTMTDCPLTFYPVSVVGDEVDITV